MRGSPFAITSDTRMRAFDQQVPFELSNRIEYLHRHATGCAGQIHAAQG